MLKYEMPEKIEISHSSDVRSTDEHEKIYADNDAGSGSGFDF
jgi:hypothetical protein